MFTAPTTEGNTSRSRLGPTLFAAATLIAPLLILWTILRLAVNVPFEDDWDVLWFDVARWREGQFGGADLFAFHNEHPVAAVRLIVLGLGVLTDGSVVAESLAGFALVVLTLACVWRMASLSAGRHSSGLASVLAFLSSLTLFSGTQYGMWLWGFVAVQWCLMNFAAAGMVWAFTEWPGRWIGLGLAALFATVGTLSHAAGVTLWVVGALAILLGDRSDWARRRLRFLILWCGITLFVVLILWWSLDGLGGQRPTLFFFLAHFVDVGVFVITCLGLPWSGGPFDPALVAGIAIFCLPILIGWILWRRRDWRRLIAPWLLLGVYGLLFAGTIAAGRFQYGRGAALAARYATGTALFWVGFTGMATVALATPRNRGPLGWRRYVAAALLLAAVAAYGAGYVFGYGIMLHTSRNLEFALATLYSPAGADRDVMLFLYPPGVETGRERVEELMRLQLGPFSPGMRPEGLRLAAALRPATDVQNIDGVYRAGACDVGVQGWVWDTTQPDRPVRVDIFDGNERVDTVTAGWFAQHLVIAGMGNGRHVFRYVVPETLKDGRPHLITVRVAGTGIVLKGTPIALTCKNTK